MTHPISIKLRKRTSFRPERPILSAQAEGLGTCDAGLARPCKGRSRKNGGERAFQARICLGPFPRPSTWAGRTSLTGSNTLNLMPMRHSYDPSLA
jgi:hypothetical protein